MTNSKIELYDILTIGNDTEDKDYTVAGEVVHENKKYLYLIEVDKDENIIDSNQLIVRRVIEDGNDAVELVTDEEEKQIVARLFFNLFKKMADESSEDFESEGKAA